MSRPWFCWRSSAFEKSLLSGEDAQFAREQIFCFLPVLDQLPHERGVLAHRLCGVGARQSPALSFLHHAPMAEFG